MTILEFLKKWCHNGHDPATCPKKADLEALLATERARLATLVYGADRHIGECPGCCESMRQAVIRDLETPPDALKETRTTSATTQEPHSDLETN